MMTKQAVTDYLGHPCRFSESKERFADSYSEALGKELREIRRDVGKLLLVLNDRLSHSLNASRQICSLVESVDDAEGPCALLEMLAIYEIDSANLFWKLTGLVLAGLDRDGDAPAQPFTPAFVQGSASK